MVIVDRTTGAASTKFESNRTTAYTESLDIQRDDDNMATFVARAK